MRVRLLLLAALLALACVCGAASAGSARRQGSLVPGDGDDVAEPLETETDVQPAAAEGSSVISGGTVEEDAESSSPSDEEDDSVSVEEEEEQQEDKGCKGSCTWNGLCGDGGCLCFQGWVGEACDVRECPQDCSGRGECANGECKCEVGWYGPACSVRGCPYNCNNQGYCYKDATCVCNADRQGLYCEDERGCPKGCNAAQGGGECREKAAGADENGQAREKRCYCAAGWTGDDCTEKTCPAGCSGNGECDPKTGQCTCKDGHVGEDCSKLECPKNCTGHGVCDHGTGECACEEGYFGPDCAPENCALNCSSHGTCRFDKATERSTCDCDRAWSGEGCDLEICPGLCGEKAGHGKCGDAGCECEPEWEGKDCGTRRCPDGCNGNGLCNTENTKTDSYECNCFAGWSGKSCNRKLCPLECSHRGTCNNGTCVCDAWWTGEHCEAPQCKNDCSQQGTCVLPEMPSSTMNADEIDRALADTSSASAKLQAQLAQMPKAGVRRAYCECSDGWGEQDCSAKVCPNKCSGVGVCHQGACWCPPGRHGDDCGQAVLTVVGGNGTDEGSAASLTPLERCEARCSKKHGKCFEAPAGSSASAFAEPEAGKPSEYVCHCANGWAGETCAESLTECPAKCRTEAGVCRPGCLEPKPDSCPTSVADSVCSGNGHCVPTAGGHFRCACDEGYGGDACTAPGCPNDCSGDNGMCNSDRRTCLCKAGFTGADCSQTVSSKK